MKFKRNEKGELELDASGNPIPLPEERTVTMTETALRALIAEEVKRASNPEQVAQIAADTVQKFLDESGARAQVAKVVIGGAKAEQVRKTGWARMSEIAAAALNAAVFGRQTEGIDLGRMQNARSEAFERTGQSTTTTAGGYLIPTEEVLSPVDLIGAEESLIGQCNNVPMQTGSTTIVTADGDITVYWIPETTNTSSMDSQATGQKQESQYTFGRVTLTKHWVVARVALSKQAQMYSGGALESFLRTRTPMRLRKACEVAMLRGAAVAASDPVTGLDSLITGDNVIPWNAADPFKAVMDTMYAPEIALPGVAETDLAVTNARGMLALRNVKDANKRPILGDPTAQTKNFPSLWGYPCLKSANVLATYPAAAGTDSRLYAGDFKRHAHVGMDGLTLAVDPYTGLKNNIVYLQFEMSFAFTVTSASAFAYTDVPR